MQILHPPPSKRQIIKQLSFIFPFKRLVLSKIFSIMQGSEFRRELIFSIIMLSSFALANVIPHLDIRHPNWCYIDTTCGPTSPEWKGECGSGTEQSPIDLVTTTTTTLAPVSQENWTINFSNDYCNDKNGYFINNNGHTAEIYFDRDRDSPSFTISGSAFTDTYQFLQFHFHWGSNDSQGSEHTIDGKKFPAELHIVHKLPRPTSERNGLAVLGIFLQVSDTGIDNPALTPILDTFNCINASMDLMFDYKYKKVNLAKLLPKEKEIFRYNGSLTTPNCDETVLWTVFEHPILISRQQLNKFRNMKTLKAPSHHGSRGREIKSGELVALGDNFRPIQQLGARTVLRAKIMSNC